MLRFWRFGFVIAFAGLLALPPIGATQAALPSPSGPCTAAAARSMPEGSGHRHLDIDQHRFACRVALAYFDDLHDELSQNPDVILGEMDIESGIMAIAVAFPEAGVLFYNVRNPARPVFKSWFRFSNCEEVVVDVDCGAYVDLSEDGKLAFLSLQQISVIPGDDAESKVLPPTPPGVQVINVSDPTAPVPNDFYGEASGVGGTHTSTSHVIPAKNPVNPGEDPATRDAGEYLFSVQNVDHVDIGEVKRDPITGVATVDQVTEIPVDELHDMYIDNDKLTGRTYLYVAGGFATGFYIYDVTNPAKPVLKGEWDLTPHCAEDWYGHTTFTVVRDGRRYVTIDAEAFGGNGEFGEQSAADQRQGCGEQVGNGDKPGPLWIVDATHFSQLRPANDKDGEEKGTVAQQVRQNSRNTLVTTWTNPARQEAGNIEFSPHNQQVVGNRIYLSHYHGGVYMLNAKKAFSGIRGSEARPTEQAFVVPSKKPVRPHHKHVVDPVIPFISTFFGARPTVWDTLFYRGCVLIPDSTGGLYSYAMGGPECGGKTGLPTGGGGGDNGGDNGDDDDDDNGDGGDGGDDPEDSNLIQ